MFGKTLALALLILFTPLLGKFDPPVILWAAPKGAGSSYVLRASTAQPLIGTLSAGSWALRPGFWPNLPQIASINPQIIAQIVYDFRLDQNYPNPFNPATNFQFTVPGLEGLPAHARLVIYDLRGRLVRVLINGLLPAGPHQAGWNGQDSRGRALPSGVYFGQLQIGPNLATKQLVILK